MRNQRQENQQRQGVQPPVHTAGRARSSSQNVDQVRHHQDENQQRDEARLQRHLAQPFAAARRSAGRTVRRSRPPPRPPTPRRSRNRNGRTRRSREKKRQAEAGRDVVERDQREGAESPEDEGVRESGQRALADHFALQQHFPDEFADARAERRERGNPASGATRRMMSSTVLNRRQKSAQRRGERAREQVLSVQWTRRDIAAQFECSMSGTRCKYALPR